MLEVDVRHAYGSFDLAARFSAGQGLVALFGRSGSGKSSIVDIVAGLVRPDKGRVVLGGRVLVDTDAGTFVPVHRRGLGYVFQDSRLFPHLTVRQNLLYGRWFNRAAGAPASFDGIVDLLGLAHLLPRRPVHLSGGEKQRVAIGRALLAAPRALLMDEPLASLDEPRRQDILPYIERMRDEARIPIVYVSHSIAEVTRLATSMVLLSEGRVAAVGPTAEVMQRVDLFPLTGRAEAGAVIEAEVACHDDEFGLTELRAASGTWRLGRIEAAPGSAVRLRIRARDVMLATEEPTGVSALNVLPGIVQEIGESTGPAVDVRIDCRGDRLVARVTRYSVANMKLASGTPVYVLVKSAALDRRSVGFGGRHPPPRSMDLGES